METENRWPKVGHIIVDEVDGKPHIYIEYEYEEETPPTVERQRDCETTYS